MSYAIYGIILSGRGDIKRPDSNTFDADISLFLASLYVVCVPILGHDVSSPFRNAINILFSQCAVGKSK